MRILFLIALTVSLTTFSKPALNLGRYEGVLISGGAPRHKILIDGGKLHSCESAQICYYYGDCQKCKADDVVVALEQSALASNQFQAEEVELVTRSLSDPDRKLVAWRFKGVSTMIVNGTPFNEKTYVDVFNYSDAPDKVTGYLRIGDEILTILATPVK